MTTHNPQPRHVVLVCCGHTELTTWTWRRGDPDDAGCPQCGRTNTARSHDERGAERARKGAVDTP